MSCRKYEAPRHGSLAYTPKKRARTIRQPSPATPPDNPAVPPHLTSFLTYKAGMTHILRITTTKSNDKKAREVRKEVIDAVTLLEAPEMVVYGVRVYVRGVNGLKLKEEILSGELSENLLARFVKRHGRSKRVHTDRNEGDAHTNENSNSTNGQAVADKLAVFQNNPHAVIKVLAHTKIANLKLNCKKAHILEIQVNGGSTQDKADFCARLLNSSVSISSVFGEQELVTISGVTKGKGFTGVVKRFGVRVLPRKSNKGIRKVACIGAWHPAGVLRTVARAGQMGCFKRTQANKKVLKVGNALDSIKTEFDLTEKTINPMGGFLKYGKIKNDYLMVKGPCIGPSRRVLTVGKAFTHSKKDKNTEVIDIKFVDTSSKMGHGRFQTIEEKAAYYSK